MTSHQNAKILKMLGIFKLEVRMDLFGKLLTRLKCKKEDLMEFTYPQVYKELQAVILIELNKIHHD